MKKIVLLFCIVASVLTVQAQEERGFGGKAEIGYGLGLGNDNHTLNVNLMPGYHFNPHWFAGVGVGYQLLMNDLKGTAVGSMSVVPVFAHGQWNITAGKKVTPFIGTKVGYAIGTKKSSEIWDGPISEVTYKAQGQLLFGFDAGVKYAVGGSAVYASLYYECTDLKYSSNLSKETHTRSNQTLGLKLGWEF